jgi:hypothetical protein
VDVRQVAEPLVEVEAIADEELVGNRESDVGDRQVVDEASVGPVEQRDGGDRARRAQGERSRQRVQRETGVDDVLDKQDVLIDDVEVEVLEQPDRRRATGRAAAVSRELDEVDPVDDRERPGKVGEEDEARLEAADQNRVAPRVVRADLGSELDDAGFECISRQVNVADSRVGVRRTFSVG